MRFCVVFLTVWTASVPPNCSSANERASWPRWDESSNNVFKNPAFSPQVWRCVCVCAAEGLRVIWTRNYYYCCLYFIIIFCLWLCFSMLLQRNLKMKKIFSIKLWVGRKAKRIEDWLSFSEKVWNLWERWSSIFPIKSALNSGCVWLSVQRCWRGWELVVRKHLSWLTQRFSRKLSRCLLKSLDWFLPSDWSCACCMKSH